ncbi:hypothetical protein SAMN05421543_11045 [Alicyclobacillus macrosporangiidus]|uniref:Uncharacterized protein n=1 Tax=Alicyclobacillus macrosporangiidus TaxID=392015 RepID=A0A1I7JI46_9BACL|nr:hypothetical protein SAMN05421543_11045 [Alicyclobacillus macrosporangiidus]
MEAHDNLEEYQDPVTYDSEYGNVGLELPFFEGLARETGGPVLELAYRVRTALSWCASARSASDGYTAESTIPRGGSSQLLAESGPRDTRKNGVGVSRRFP